VALGDVCDETGGMGVKVAPMHPRQRHAVEPLLRACGTVFSEEEIRVALGMLEDALCGAYSPLAAVEDRRFAGYCLAGPTPLTESTWHLYWLCVHPQFQRRGVASALQSALENTVRTCGGKRIVVETGGRPEYHPARAFYHFAGYIECGRIADYYRPGDACSFLCKVLT
jgi:ribosomal protein S18 acetylase RimI-like enzyme